MARSSTSLLARIESLLKEEVGTRSAALHTRVLIFISVIAGAIIAIPAVALDTISPTSATSTSTKEKNTISGSRQKNNATASQTIKTVIAIDDSAENRISNASQSLDNKSNFQHTIPSLNVTKKARDQEQTLDKLANLQSEKIADGMRYFENKEYAKALQIYSQYANAGHPDAQVLLGEMLWYGDGIASDQNAAEILFKKAAVSGNVRAGKFLEFLAEREKYRSEIAFYMNDFDGGKIKFNETLCASPKIPAASGTNEDISTVSKNYNNWVACYNTFAVSIYAVKNETQLIPQNIFRLMRDDELKKAHLHINEVLGQIASHGKIIAEEVQRKYRSWQSTTNQYVQSNNEAKLMLLEHRMRKLLPEELLSEPRPLAEPEKIVTYSTK